MSNRQQRRKWRISIYNFANQLASGELRSNGYIRHNVIFFIHVGIHFLIGGGMWRYLVVFLMLTATAKAQTPPCIPVDPGWTQTYTIGQIQMISYNLTTKNMVVSFRTSPPSNRAFQNVPLSVAQQVYSLRSADAYFAANIAPRYPEALLTTLQSNLCPLLTQSLSWIYTHPVAPMPTLVYLYNDTLTMKLKSDSGIWLTRG